MVGGSHRNCRTLLDFLRYRLHTLGMSTHSLSPSSGVVVEGKRLSFFRAGGAIFSFGARARAGWSLALVLPFVGQVAAETSGGQ